MSLAWWAYGGILGAVWVWRAAEAIIGLRNVADLSNPQWDKHPSSRLTIIVPAKDEGENIEQCLKSLLTLDYANYDIVAVDDRSVDQTGAIMDRLQSEHPEKLRVIHITEVPPGWLGKTHAMWKGAETSTGDWILFTDGDVLFRADTLRRTVAYAESAGADHLVLFPTLIMHGFGERMALSAVQAVFSLWQRPWKVQDPTAKDHVGAGAFNLIRRDAYEALGTYQALRLQVLDDIKLGKAIKDHGFTQHCVFGRDLVRVRWAIGAFGVVNNLTKNFFSLLYFNWLLTLAVVCVLIVFNVGIPAGLVLAPGIAKTGFALAYLSIAALYVRTSRWSPIQPLYFVFYPLAAALFIFAILRSMIVTLRQGGIVWRGTKYSLDQLRSASADSN
jgi:cellulose synthase/poly-beta-1,6-N-acetylglucosamine synthase-like glycosyltransferase